MSAISLPHSVVGSGVGVTKPSAGVDSPLDSHRGQRGPEMQQKSSDIGGTRQKVSVNPAAGGSIGTQSIASPSTVSFGSQLSFGSLRSMPVRDNTHF
jgi:hypothetical protein